nr:hypothetical protein Iba_chr06eCG11150 [Ipomoea batatas]
MKNLAREKQVHTYVRATPRNEVPRQLVDTDSERNGRDVMNMRLLENPQSQSHNPQLLTDLTSFLDKFAENSVGDMNFKLVLDAAQNNPSTHVKTNSGGQYWAAAL